MTSSDPLKDLQTLLAGSPFKIINFFGEGWTYGINIGNIKVVFVSVFSPRNRVVFHGLKGEKSSVQVNRLEAFKIIQDIIQKDDWSQILQNSLFFDKEHPALREVTEKVWENQNFLLPTFPNM